MYSKILIRYGELVLKKHNRQSFINQLSKNIASIIGQKALCEYDRAYLEYSENNLKKLQYIFGIVSYSPVLVTDSEIDEIKDKALSLIKPDTKTFKIATRRNDKSFEFDSSQINNIVGSFVLQNIKNISVDVNNPDQVICIEVRKNNTYIFSEIIKGLGGLPVGISGEVLHLISGGIDSPVAAFELMKRGLKVNYLTFITPPQTNEKTLGKIKNLVQTLCKYQGKSKLLIGNYSKLMNYLALTTKPAYKITLMRRSFYRIASRLADEKNILAISNGENLGQVASQTLESMNVISNAANKIIFRPLLTKDKVETINIAEKIGTYKISIIKANETCELFAPKEPVTKPLLKVALALEKELGLIPSLESELIENQISKEEILIID